MQKTNTYKEIRVFPYLKYRFPLYYLLYSVNIFVRYFMKMKKITNYSNSNNITNLSKTKIHYSLWFSNIYDFIFYPVLHPIRKKVAIEIKKLGLNYVIDMCCGTGNQLKYLKQLGILKLTGIDISENMIAKAKKNGVVEFCQKRDATKTGFLANSYEGVLLSFVLHETNVKQAQEIMDEAIRISTNDGKIIIIDYVFDNKSKLIGRYLSIITEWLIGGEHYKNFSKYIHNNLLKEYTKHLTLIKEHKYIFNSVRIQIYSK